VLGAVVRVTSFRLGPTLRRRWAGYLTLVILVGLVGGIALSALAGARRTQSSYPVYLASTHPTDAEIFSEFEPVTGVGFSAKVNDAIARVPGVARAQTVVGFDGTIQVLGQSLIPKVPGEAPPSVEGSTGGEYFGADRVSLLQGRFADPSRVNELMLSPGAVRSFGLHVGSILRMAVFTSAQVAASSFEGYPTDRPRAIVDFRLVGVIETGDQIVADDSAALGDQLAVVTPAFTARFEQCCAYYSYDVLDFGATTQRANTVAAIDKVLPNLGPVSGEQTNAPIVGTAERALRPVSIAIGIFGLLAALAALLVGSQVIGRIIRRNADDAAALRALGAGPLAVMADSLFCTVGAIVVGALLADGVAVALSPLFPIGPVRTVYPYRGVNMDWTVLGLGFLFLALGLSAVAVMLASRSAPHRVRPLAVIGDRWLTWTRAVATLPASATLGIRSALGLDSGPSRGAPVRSALLGTVVAVTVIVTSLTFASSLHALVARPSLYGWNWNYALLSGFSGAEDLPAAQTAALLNRDPSVAHWAGASFEDAALDGQRVPVLAMRPGAAVTPSMLSGHAIASSSEVVLGRSTLRTLRTHVGATITAKLDGGRRVRLRIVGTATFPTISNSGPGGLEMGVGALMSTSLFSARDLDEQGSPVPGPNMELISVRPDVPDRTALRSLNGITTVLNRSSDPDGPVGGVVPALRPAEIAEVATGSTLAALLAAALALGALAALALTLGASVRQRQREFAVVKVLGFTERQLATSVAWQATSAAVIGAAFGIPIGIVLGRWLWTLFADGIYAVPHPTIPATTIALVAMGSLVFTNLVAVIPGRMAARTRTSLLLRAE
jgi:ABC-type antimicrobial peptide transport system permease subunit